MANTNISTSDSDASRNSEGRFVSKDVTSEDLPKLVHKSSEMTGALNDLQEEKERAEVGKPLVSVSVNNPISWFMKWLKDLKKKQITTFTFKLGVPLVALPIIIIALLSFIVAMSARSEKNSKGEAVASITPTPSPGSVYIMSKSGTLKIVKGEEEKEYFLVLPSGEAVRLEVPKNLDIDGYENKKVFVSGKYNAITGMLSVERFSDMEPLSTLLPIPTNTSIEPLSSPTSASENI